LDLRLRHHALRARLHPAILVSAALLLSLPPLRFASAMERIKVSPPPPDGTTSQTVLSGSIVRSATATTAWFFYPGACDDRANGTWAPRSSPQADSLNTYAPGSTGGYTVTDQTQGAILWHVSDNAACTPGSTCPPALGGSRMIWCGAFDANWVLKYGYPNFAYQILYIDTGSHAGNYNLTLDYQFSGEQGYDAVYLIGGGGGAVDPIGNSRAQIDAVIAEGNELVQWTGSITPASPNATGGNTTAGGILVSDNPGSPATVTGASFTIDAANRALYLVFESDCFNANEDGLWPDGHGQMIDNLATSDNGAIYTDQAAAGGVDAFSGNVLVGTPGAPVVSARVPPGVGTLWKLVAGSSLPTPDTCTPKSSASDLVFEGGNATTFHTVPNQFNSIASCTFPVPAGTGSIVARWSQYEDLPRYQGYVQFAEYRYFKDSIWSRWRNTFLAGTRRGAALQFWYDVRAELAEATQADSVQIRYSVQCVPALAADHNNCGDVIYGVLYDNFRLEILTGVPLPVFGILPPFIAQSTFVDGTMAGAGCNGASVAAGTCWPGVRGSDTGLPGAVHDNFNSPLGDSIVVSIGSGLRRNGKGINWHRAFDRSVGSGLTIAHTNPNFVGAFDAPRVIYRLFDPATATWSPFDSSELDANAFSADGGDTVLIDTRFRMNWPPRDKIGSPLPGGFSINGKALYSQLAFLPRGTRMQYYWKGVDLNGGTVYQFSSDWRAYETEDLPALPGSGIIAPDILEFDVLPRVYSTAGTTGTLVAGKRSTPILNLDGAYTRWSYSIDPVTQALKTLGVRADRYRPLQGEEEGSHIGGHELAGTRVNRLASYFPNTDEYAIMDSLAGWYRIMIESSHTSTTTVDEEADAKLLKEWWEASTGTDGGDRCIFASGDDYFNALLQVTGVPNPNEQALATSVFGVAGVTNQWNGGGSVIFPTIKDLFADPAAGPGLGSGSYIYQVDGGCPAANRFDALTKIGSTEAQNSATYPAFASVTNVAGISYMTERDAPGDHDRNKALGYGFSIQFVRQGGENLLDNRAQVLYKFLTSCRGPRTVSDTAFCWPCPTDANKYGNWAVLSGFQTGTYGPLYAIQNGNLAAAGAGVTPAPSFVDALMQNRPNPFNPETVIPYSLSVPGRVAVRVYDVRGRLVRTLIDAVQPAGLHAARWNGSVDSGTRSASGIYFYVITYPDGHTSSKKMAILR
jgi:hypothetical protein